MSEYTDMVERESRTHDALDLPRGCRSGVAIMACLLLTALAVLAIGVIAVAVFGWRLIFGGPL